MSRETKPPEPSVLEYARYYRLSRNHLEIDPLALVPRPDEALLQSQDESEPLSQQLNAGVTTPPPERLTAVKEASTLLAVTDPTQYHGCKLEDVDLIPIHRTRNLKIELPLLRSDHEADMLDFVHHIEPNLANEFIPFEKVDNEQDEGLGWPSYCYDWPEMFFQKAQKEKINELENIHHALVEKDALTPAKRQLDNEIANPNTSAQNSLNIGGLYSPLKDIHIHPSPPQPKRRRALDLKVEVPLTPKESDHQPPWESRVGSVSEALQILNPAFQLQMPEPEQTSTEDIDMLFAEHVAPRAARAEWGIEQEQLQEADTTCRVPVPVMDFSKPKPPWENFASGEQMASLSGMKEAQLSLPQWQLDSRILRELSWRPFQSSLGHLQLDETIEDDGSLASFIAEPQATDLDTLIWKSPRLRLFEVVYDSDEEEIEFGNFQSAKDVQSLIKMRTHELQSREADGDVLHNMRDSWKTHTSMSTDRGRDLQLSKGPSPQQGIQIENADSRQVALRYEFSAIDALDEFLGLRTGNGRDVHEVIEKRSRAIASETVHEPPRPHTSAENKKANEPTSPMPTPHLQIPTNEAFFVASTSFLSNRTLARLVQSLYPSANIIERDFALYSLEATCRGTQMKGSRASSEVLTDEADLVLSPSTGLILTSIQKVKQQALPGQATRSPIRERIQRVAIRYERLVLVVTRTTITSDKDDSCSIGGLDESDCEALTSLMAFSNHVPALSDGELLLVDGDISVLARWIVSLMVKYSSDNCIKLIEEETLWEVFLRQAGMNAFAAQAVLAEIKVIAERTGGELGLRGFILMNPEERHQRFERCFGGKGVLERVGKVFDARW
ncbi:MAG: hypothetical protein Q9182_000424 [Xanthomendoza sp. 2 TL-2023]